MTIVVREYTGVDGHSPFGRWIYFGRDGDRLIILLAGGTKKRQSADIEKAKACWTAYKLQKKKGAK
jgi:putative addiction module killer protein